MRRETNCTRRKYNKKLQAEEPVLSNQQDAEIAFRRMNFCLSFETNLYMMLDTSLHISISISSLFNL